ncbi:MAG: class I SAM-dependent methyltransferase [Candidatus Hydrogenedentes bacterium]|nr:class I SAM-dependent methyltransferase [Candidatus Hydrogenedentota bacterium]
MSIVYTHMFLLKKILKVLKIVFAIAQTYSTRLRSKDRQASWAYLRYACNNLFVSFCNGHFNAKRVFCPCCGWSGYDFIPIDGGIFWVPRMVCPACLSYDRHRAFSLYVKQYDRRLLETAGTTLHVAPETYVAILARQNTGHHYIVTDLFFERLQAGNGTPFQSDIQQLSLPDRCVDTLICFHVLEHIKDDRAAVAELYRVLKPGGVAYIMVPINTTFEETQFFGEPNPDIYDHYWAPGKDYHTHLGIFDSCVEVAPEEFLSPEDVFRYGAPSKEIIFVCKRNG